MTPEQRKKQLERNRAKSARYRQRHPDKKRADSIAYYYRNRKLILARKQATHPMLKKKCKVCGARFETRHPLRITCTDKCSEVNNRNLNRESRYSPEYRKRQREYRKAFYSNPANRERQRLACKNYYRLPGKAARSSALAKKRLMRLHARRRVIQFFAMSQNINNTTKGKK